MAFELGELGRGTWRGETGWVQDCRGRRISGAAEQALFKDEQGYEEYHEAELRAM